MSFPKLSTALALATLLATIPIAARTAPQATQTDDVVAAARKAKEQQKKDTSKPAKVYTNEDLANLKGTVSVVGQTPAPKTAPGTPENPAAPAAPPAAAPGKTTTAPDKSAELGGNDEAGWRAKFADQRRVLADDAKELDILQREFNLKQQQYYSDPNVALREQNDRKDLDDSQAKISAKQEDVDRDKQAIVDLEDALRKAGGDPGWATPPAGSSENPPS